MEIKTRQGKIHSKYKNQKNQPWLNLSGLWLTQAGFIPGQQIEITVDVKQLTIKPL